MIRSFRLFSITYVLLVLSCSSSSGSGDEDASTTIATTPEVVGFSQLMAKSKITAAGLALGTVSQKDDDTVPADDVISQSPVGGTRVGAGSSVDLVVSMGPAVIGFSDEFTSDTLPEWTLRHQIEGTDAQYSLLNINQRTPGKLTIVPNQTPGWFAASDAPLVFKLLSGDFSVHINVIADSVSNPGQPPSSNFNSAGLMARNPSGDSNPENYVMLNLGRQDGRVGSETKTTVNSSSTLVIDSGEHSGDLVLCRIEDDFYSFRRLTGDADWIRTTVFNRPDLPATLQVGMVVNAFDEPADLHAEFDFIRLLPTPTSESDCIP